MSVLFVLAALIGGGFTSLAAGPEVATPSDSDKIYAEGLQLFGDLGNEGALKRGFKLFQQAAVEGNADAANAVGVAKLFGFGTEMDPAEAAKQLGEAADKGSAKANYNLALLFLDGPAPTTNERKGLQQMEKAALKGDVPAQYLLGQALLSSNTFDPNAALAWFEKAGRAGDERAMAFAGALHLAEQIDKPNKKLALTLLGQLSEAGNFQAKYFLGEHLAELGTDHAEPVKAVDYLIQAHELGGRPYPLARARGLIADVAAGKAGLQATNVKTFLEEKAQRSCVANYLVAELFLLSESIYKDDRKGRSLLEEGVEMGCDLARERLGDMYAKGIGVKKNPSRAQKYYLAASEGSSDAALKLAIITVELATSARELKVAYQSAIRSAKMGNARAYGVLATILDQEGTGEENRRVKAYAWALLAAKDLPTVKHGQLADLEKSLTADQLREGKMQAQYLWLLIKAEALKRGEKSFRF